MNFSEKVKNQKLTDKKSFMKSYTDITRAALGGERYVGKKTEKQHDQFVNALNQITDYYKLENIEVTQAATEDGEALDTVLGRTGVTRRKVKLNDKWWVKGYGPTMAETIDGDTIALIPKLFGGYYYISPRTGKKVSVNKNTAKNISEVGFCFYKPFPNKSMTSKDLVKSVFTTFTTSDVMFLLFVTLISTLLGLISPYISNYIYDKVIPSGVMDQIWPLAALMLGMSLTSLAFGLFQSMWLTRIADKVQFGTQGALWIRLLNLPVNFFKKYSSGDLYQRTAMLDTVCNDLSSNLLPTLLSAAFSFVYLFQISQFAQALLLPSFLIISITVGTSLLTGQLSAKLNERANEVSPKLSGLVNQLFNGISKIKIAGAEVRAFSKWSEIYSKVAKIQYSPGFYLKIASSINGVISVASSMLIYFVVAKNNISAPDYMAFSAAYGSFSSAIFQMSGIVTEIAYLKPAIKMLEPILKEVPEINTEKVRVDKLRGDIEATNVTFKYQEDGPTILDGLNIKIKSGEYVALVGSTGCGKSTFVRLLLGFEEPNSGSISIDDQMLDTLDLHSVRKRMGMVLQNGKLFSDSIFENIVISSPDSTLEDAWEAARKAGVAEDIERMPMQMHTLLGEDGAGLSGGQRQRIMIARALISNPDVLIFDEATSALDNITQSMVVETLDKMDITRIVIAHRLSTIKNCDRIIYIDKGKVAEEGTYEELMAKNGLFAELARRQIA